MTNSQAKHLCPVCGLPTDEEPERIGQASQITCHRCGTFQLPDASSAILGDPSRNDGLLNSEIKKASVGHWLQERQRGGNIPKLRSNTLKQLSAEAWFPSLHDQRDHLLRMVGDAALSPGERIRINSVWHQYAVGARTPGAVAAIVDHIVSEGLARAEPSGGAGGSLDIDIRLTFAGWLAYEEIQRGQSRGRTAFIAMPFGHPDLEDEWLPALRDAVGETGFTLRRNDDEPKPGLIDIRMRVQIQEARFLLVELTHANLGAYWEAGYAEGLGKPVIYTCREGESAHFDVDHSLRIEWSPDAMEPALERIKATIRNSLPDADSEPDEG